MRRRCGTSPSVLQPGGHLVLLVPALPALYGTLDIHLHHFRRYAPRGAAQQGHGRRLRDRQLRYLNRPGRLRLVAQLARAEAAVMPTAQLSAFKWLMPLLRLEEKKAPGFGLSLLVLAERP